MQGSAPIRQIEPRVTHAPTRHRIARSRVSFLPRFRKGSLHSFSNPWLVNFSVRQFSPTVRTVPSGTPEGTLA